MKYLSNISKLLFLILPVLLSAEGWNSIVTTTATVDNISSNCFYLEFAELDQFVNSGGLHLVVADNDGISYKRFNTNGTVFIYNCCIR